MKKTASKIQSDSKPFISVVIPAYNEEQYLPACLDALNKQSYPRDKFEILLIDNNSSDKTATVAKAAHVKVITEKKQGHVFALDTGMRKAQGEIIAVTDADTKVKQNWLETIEKLFRDESIVGVTGFGEHHVESKLNQAILKYTQYLYFKAHFALGKTGLSGLSFAVRKEAFYKVNGLDTRYRIFSDAELGLRIKKIGKVVFCKDLLASTSARRMKKGSFEDQYKYLNSYFKTVWLQQPPKGDLTPRR